MGGNATWSLCLLWKGSHITYWSEDKRCKQNASGQAIRCKAVEYRQRKQRNRREAKRGAERGEPKEWRMTQVSQEIEVHFISCSQITCDSTDSRMFSTPLRMGKCLALKKVSNYNERLSWQEHRLRNKAGVKSHYIWHSNCSCRLRIYWLLCPKFLIGHGIWHVITVLYVEYHFLLFAVRGMRHSTAIQIVFEGVRHEPGSAVVNMQACVSEGSMYQQHLLI